MLRLPREQGSESHHQFINRRSVLRILGPAYAEKRPHSIVQPTLDGISISRLFRHSVVTLLLFPLYHLDVFLDMGVWHIMCKQLKEVPDYNIESKTKFGPTSRMVMPKLYISPLADTATCSSNISGAHHLQLSDSPLVWVIRLPSSCKSKFDGNTYDYKRHYLPWQARNP